MKATIGILALVAGLYYLSTTTVPIGSHNNETITAATETKPPPPILSMADILASSDLLTAMGQVAARDNYNLGEFLKRVGYPISKEKQPELAEPDPSKVDENLTAEQVYSANQTDPTMSFIDASTNPPPPTFTIDPDKLSASELAKLPGLERVHKMALLTLYKTRCGNPSSLELNVITNQFAELPQKLQDIALTDESRAIKARQPYDDAKAPSYIPPAADSVTYGPKPTPPGAIAPSRQERAAMAKLMANPTDPYNVAAWKPVVDAYAADRANRYKNAVENYNQGLADFYAGQKERRGLEAGEAKRQIELRKGQIIRGGWTWFCSRMHHDVLSDDGYGGMFTTAMEMRR